MNYYNEYDAGAAAWLRELIKQNLIPNGYVDTRSITEVKPDDLKGFTQCHFFAGIGGWSYALQLAEWPADRPVWTGSCPCQPFSVAGKGKGVDDERHLWPVFAELIRACKPPTVFGEQVASKAGRDWLAGVFADLEGMGYQRAGADLCAAGVGAPHIRQRLFWVADNNNRGLERRDSVRECSSERSAGAGGVAGGVAITCDNGTRSNIKKTGGCRRGTMDSWATSLRQEHGAAGTSRPDSRSTSSLGGVADPDCQRCDGEHSLLRQNESGWHQRSVFETAWSGQTIQCRDGKTRRIPIEPAFFPLADGLPGRVGLLRGAGNAIVPQVAAEFVGAYLDCLQEDWI